jgi:quercetin dioxygenase-like cupin family protein
MGQQQDLSELFEQGAVLFPDLEVRAAEKPWYAPPAWKGVFLKDLVTGKETGGAFSYHLMRVERNCEIPDHAHETQWSWNVILRGAGSFVLGGKQVPVEVGQTVVTPPRVHHAVSAGDDEILLQAIFVPALG